MKLTERSPSAARRSHQMASARCETTSAWPVTCDEFTAAPNHQFAPHAHEQPHVCFVLGGTLIERDGRRPNRMPAGVARLSPAGDAHDLAVGDGSPLRCLVLSVDAAVIDDPRGLARDGRRYCEGPGVRSLAERMLGELRADDDASPISLEMLAIETAALGWHARGPVVSETPPWLVRVCERLRDDPNTLPALDELAHEAGVGRSSLARAFRLRYGCTIGQYVRSRRLEVARRLVLGSETPLATVALESGFADQSHMTRLFAARFGMPPGRLRSALTAG